MGLFRRKRPDPYAGAGTAPWFVQVPFLGSWPGLGQVRRGVDHNGTGDISFAGFVDQLRSVGRLHRPWPYPHEELMRRCLARDVALPSIPVVGETGTSRVYAIGAWAGHPYVVTCAAYWAAPHEPVIYPYPKQWLTLLRVPGETDD